MKQLRMILVLAGLGITPILKAQVDTARKVYRISALEAVDMALKQRIEILNAALDVRNQEAMNAEITGSALPQIKGTGYVNHYFNIPTTVLPDFISPNVYGVLVNEEVRDGNGVIIKAPDSYATFPAQFGTPWQANVGLSIQQLLFQPDVFVGLKARNTAIKVYEEQLEVQKDSVKSNVYRSYYGVLIAQKGLQFARESESRLAKLYSDQDQMFKNGFIERLDLDKTQVSLNNVRTTVVQLRNMVQVGYAGLKFAMAIPQKDSLILVDTLSNDEIKKDILTLENDFKYEDRSELRAMATSTDLMGYQVKRYKLAALPTLSAAYSLGTSAQRAELDFFDTKQKWFPNSYLGINLSMNIFDGNQRRNRVKQAEYAVEKSENTLKQFRQLVDFQIVASRTQLVNAIEALSSQEENKELAEKVYSTTKTKYEGGLGSSFEVLQSETSLQDALNNYFQALYNAIIAKIGYRRALGQL